MPTVMFKIGPVSTSMLFEQPRYAEENSDTKVVSLVVAFSLFCPY